jgi:hypothetical protein
MDIIQFIVYSCNNIGYCGDIKEGVVLSSLTQQSRKRFMCLFIYDLR